MISRIVILLLLIPVAFAICTKDQTESYLTAGTSYVAKQKEVDYVIVLDKSGSMEGEKLAKVKEAAKALVDLMPPTDRAAIISFNYQANTDQSLTTDHKALYDAIDSIQAGFSTTYVPALILAQKEFSSSDRAKGFIFLSDGKDDYSDKMDDVLRLTEALSKQGACIMTISYALGGEESELLKQMGLIGEKYGCGDHFTASEKGTELLTVFSRIHEQTSSLELLSAKTEITNDGFSTSATSKLNNKVVPGYYNDTCADSPKYTVDIYKGDQKITTFTQSSGVFNMAPGSYDYRTSVYLDCGGTCSYSGYDKGSFSIGGVCRPSYEQLASYVTGDTQTVQITSSGFVPKSITGKQGTLVVWKNTDDVPRHLTSSKFDSTIPPGGTFTYVIENIGTLVYSDPDKKISGTVSPIHGSGTDILLVIDVSGSMAGSGISEVKLAAKKFFSLLSPVDRGALIAFAQEAYLIQDFTSDKEILNQAAEQLRAEGSTSYIKALALADTMRQTQRGVIVFMSDGLPTDPEGETPILSASEALRKKGWCLMTVGFGEEGVAARSILTRMAGDDQCTAFLYSSNGKLAETFGTVYQLAQTQQDMSFVNDSIPSITFFPSAYISAQLLTTTGKLVPSGEAPSCAPEADVQARTSFSSTQLIYSNGSYIGGLSLRPGMQTITIIASLSAQDQPGRVFTAKEVKTILMIPPYWVAIALLIVFATVIVIYWRRKQPV